MEKLQDSSRRAARWRAAIQILSLPLLGSATASNLFGQCTQENSRVEENICSEKRPIKLLFSSSQASEGPLACFAACPGFLRASASQPLLLQNNFGQRGKNQCNIDALQKIATIFKVFSKKKKSCKCKGLTVVFSLFHFGFGTQTIHTRILLFTDQTA